MGLLSRLLGLGRRATPEMIEDIARMTPPPRIPSRMTVEIQQPRGQTGSRYRIELDSQKNGFVTVTDDGETWRVNNSHLDPDLRGQGHGVRLYEDAAQRAREAGARVLRSDHSVSPEAQNAWLGLQRRGYSVNRIDGPDGPRFEVDLTELPSRITRPPREIAPNGMTIRPSEPFRNSMRGGNDDLAEAASMGRLPMDEASRMARAREMGFDPDTPLYHGTDQNIEAFRANDGWYGNGVYLSRSPQQAEYYTRRTAAQARGGQEPAPNIMPLVARGRLASVEEYEALVRQNMPRGKWTKAGEDSAVRKAQQELVRRGYAGVDAGGVDQEVVVFDPANVRSRFASFNPTRGGESDLLAGAAVAAPLVGGGLLSRARRERDARA